MNNLNVENAVNEDIKLDPRSSDAQISCVQCSAAYSLPAERDACLTHLYEAHRLIIADVDSIADLGKYLIFWAEKFRTAQLNEYCMTMKMDQLPDGTPSPNETYYMLCDVMTIDADIRLQLQWERLDEVLKQYHFECNDRSFQKECLFCRDVVTGLRADYIKHLFQKHGLNVGRPNKLVYVDELITMLEQNIENLICSYCEKVFVSRGALKDHMRKKGHKRINPNNSQYDKFYLINYYQSSQVESKPRVMQASGPAIPLVQVQRNRSRKRKSRKPPPSVDEEEDDDNDFSDEDDWQAETETFSCLYCEITTNNYETLKAHMLSQHKVDFQALIQPLNFYQRVKLINFHRRRVASLMCLSCGEKCSSKTALYKHMANTYHYMLDAELDWDVPENLKPCNENDILLRVLDDDDCSFDDDENSEVVAEQVNVKLGHELQQLKLEVNSDNESESNYSDWVEEDQSEPLRCLYCKGTGTNITALKVHMLVQHKFDFQLLMGSRSIYQRIKLINYMRSQTEQLLCFNCGSKYENEADLYTHIQQAEHYTVDEQSTWDLSSNLLPPTQSDSLLYVLDDDDDADFVNDATFDIIAEDRKVELSAAVKLLKGSRDLEVGLEESFESDEEYVMLERPVLKCLYCAHREASLATLSAHMLEAHKFDYEAKLAQLSGIYERIKFVNFIREGVRNRICVACSQQFEHEKLLLEHLAESGHASTVDGTRSWHAERYLKPSLENDYLLQLLDDDDADFQNDANAIIIAEKK